jgi:hypothetical protein
MCVSHDPWLSETRARLSASARCSPSVLKVPVTKVRLTASPPIRESAVFMTPIAKLIIAM